MSTRTPARRPKGAAAVRLNVTYRQPPARVWRALTEEKSLRRWLLPPSGDIAPRVGHRFHFTGPDGGRIACTVTEAVPEKRLAYTWQAAPDQPPTAVTWTLEPTTGGGTRLSLEHDGAAGSSPFPAGALALTACLGGARRRRHDAHHRLAVAPPRQPTQLPYGGAVHATAIAPTFAPALQGVFTCR